MTVHPVLEILKTSSATTPAHVHWLSLVESGLVPHADHQRAFKFAIVRDPYTRIVSLFHYLRHQRRREVHDFDRFLDLVAHLG